MNIKNIAMTAMMTASTLTANAQQSPFKSCFDSDWKFHYGAVEKASTPNYNDQAWRTLDLPHDWSVETEAATALGDNVGPFSKKAVGGDATGWTVGGEGWYRKHFTLSEQDLKGRVVLYFEGIYNQSEIWVNGIQVATCNYGYRPFRVDVTQQCNEAGQDNVLAVRVRNEGKNTRWYAGSGIYRHVWLERTPLVHFDDWGTTVRLKEERINLNDKLCHLQLTTKVVNGEQAKMGVTVNVEIVGPFKQKVANLSKFVKIQMKHTEELTFDIEVQNPRLWTQVNPLLYTARLTIDDGGQTGVPGHQIDVPFGIRSLEFSADEGFLLNGVPTCLNGGCVHHDNGLLGAAAYDRAETRKLELMKQHGFNAVRCSHNLTSEHFLDECDRLGLLVVDECFDQWLVAQNPDDYHQYFPTESTLDMETMVKRDRNHPSVFMWSLGNEIPGRIEPDGMKAAERLRSIAKRLDPTRPVTAAICGWDNPQRSWQEQTDSAFKSLDVGGYNYLLQCYQKDHEQYPQRVMFGSESFPQQARENWEMAEKHPFVLGDFVWTAMDYLGEAGIGSAEFLENGKKGNFFQPWPWMNGWCGDIDLIGQLKPQGEYRKVVWDRSALAIAVEEPCPDGHYQVVSGWGWPREHKSWTFPNVKEGTPLKVKVYCKERSRLFLNGQQIGEGYPDKNFCATFTVPYKPGKLVADAVIEHGRLMIHQELETTGKPTSLRMTADRTYINADGSDLAYVTIELMDEKGHVITTDSETAVSIKVTGEGTLLASGNASPTDMQSFRSTTPRLFEGRALAIVKSSRKAGTITLTVSSQGLPTQEFQITTH